MITNQDKPSIDNCMIACQSAVVRLFVKIWAENSVSEIMFPQLQSLYVWMRMVYQNGVNWN